MTFSTEDKAATIATLDGWYSGAPKRVPVTNRPSSDGAFGVTKDWRGARVITQTGLLRADTTDAAMVGSWADFAALQSDGEPSEFSVTDARGTLSCLASVQVNELELLVNGMARYELVLVARDPVKYGPAHTLTTGLPTSGGGLRYNLSEPDGYLDYGANGTLGRVTVANVGTATVWPSINVTGGLTAGFYLQRLDTGQIVRYDRVVPNGSSVQIDFRTGGVTVDHLSDASSYLTSQQFFAAAPGESFEVQFNAIGGSAGTPQMDLTISDGYW